MAGINKRYYWFKLKDDFFDSKEIRFIRTQPSGADMLIVLLKLQLKGLKTGGIIETDGIFNTVEEELAFMINEDERLVNMALNMMSKFNLVAKVNDRDVEMLLHSDLVGSETASTIRSRKSRTIKADNTQMLQCNAKMIKSNIDATKGNTEIEIEIEKEIHTDKKKKSNPKDVCVSFIFLQNLLEAYGISPKTPIVTRIQKIKPTKERLKQVLDYCKENGKGEGYVIKALEEGYSCKEKDSNTYVRKEKMLYKNKNWDGVEVV